MFSWSYILNVSFSFQFGFLQEIAVQMTIDAVLIESWRQFCWTMIFTLISFVRHLWFCFILSVDVVDVRDDITITIIIDCHARDNVVACTLQSVENK